MNGKGLSMRRIWRTALALVAASAVVVPPAAATTVQPIVIDLSSTGARKSQTITVANTNASRLPVEIRVESLAFDDDGVRIDGVSKDLAVFPAQAVIEAGRTQTFRVQWAGGPVDRSKSYYVTVAQAPVALPQGESAIQVLYNFQVLVTVAPPRAKANLTVESASIGRDADGKPAPVLVVHNDSIAHAYLSRGTLSLVERDSAGKTIFERTLAPSEIQQSIGYGLVGPGQRRSLTLPVSLPSGSGSLEARFLPATR
jgi:P pilus assembly chaperone PapD